MRTECPHCKTEFRLTNDQLKMADGMVRCGLCHKTFDALEVKQTDTQDTTSTSPSADESREPDLPELEVLYHSELFEGKESKLIPDEFRAAAIPIDYSTWTGLAWSIAILLLAFCLVIETMWFNRNQLITVNELKPFITKLCDTVDCDLMALRNPKKIEMATRNVYSHPNVENALMVSVTMINHASYAQPYPDIQIDFSDIRGEVMAGRRFSPEEYTLIDTEELSLLQPENPFTLTLEIQDPGPKAMTYQFGFY